MKISDIKKDITSTREKVIGGASSFGSTTKQKLDNKISNKKEEFNRKAEIRNKRKEEIKDKKKELSKDNKKRKYKDRIRDEQKVLFVSGLKAVSQTYRLDKPIKDSALSGLCITDFKKYFSEMINDLNRKALVELNNQASVEFITMSYVIQDVRFRETWLFSYINYKYLSELGAMLSACFTEKELSLNKDKVVLTIENFLKEAENKNIAPSDGSYRCVRLILVFIIAGNLSDASILARFVFLQISLSIDYVKKNPYVGNHNRNNIFKNNRDEDISDLEHSDMKRFKDNISERRKLRRDVLKKEYKD